jgi:hypothetical protein
MRPGQFMPRGMNLKVREFSGEFKAPAKNTFVKSNIFRKFQDDLTAVFGALFPLKDMPIHEPAGVPVGLNLGFFDSLLAEDEGLSDVFEERGVRSNGERFHLSGPFLFSFTALRE